MKKEKTAKDEIIDKILESNTMVTAKDVSNVLDDLYGNIVQRLLEAEMDNHVGYGKNSHEEKKNTNRRNGYSSKGKKVRTDHGEINVDMPRDRDGSFEPMIISKRQKVLEGYDDIVIGMYAKGLTQDDIKEMIKKIYKIDLSKQLISNLISTVSKEVQEWQNRTLQKFYPIVYIDCLYVPIREDLVSQETAIYVMLGIGIDGKKEVIGIWMDDSESSSYWTNILEEIKSRGVEDVLFFCLDGLSGLSEAIKTVFPQSTTQRCIVHLDRNLYKICPQKARKETMRDFKKIYNSTSLEQAELEYKNFLEKYEDKDKIVRKVEEYMNYIKPLFEYPKEIRKLIYTTNPIESLNSALRKVTRGKGSFPTKQAAVKVLYLRVRDLEKKWENARPDWPKILNQLSGLYGDRVLKHI